MTITTVLGDQTTRRSRPPARPAAAEVGIVGAGLCGALLALVLARRGGTSAVIDLHPEHRSDFRCEKLSLAQIALLEELGVADVLSAALPAAGGLHRNGFRYADMVNAVRAAWPRGVRFIQGRVLDISGDDGLQRIIGPDGELVRVRLAVIASGSSPALISRLGFDRETLRDGHSICIGFNLLDQARAPLPLNDLVHFGERAGDRVGYASFFPLESATRVNLFTFHDPADPWVLQARRTPLAALEAFAPGLKSRLAGAREDGAAEIRVTHLQRLIRPERPGLVVIGDAFQTSCPSTAFGVTRLLTDIRQLVARIPAWLQAEAIDVQLIADFYADPAKTDIDREALVAADRMRMSATETSLRWRLRRQAARLKRRLGRRRSPAAPPAMLRNDRARVKSAVEILATLDANGRLNGMPFMPEMIPFIGRTVTVRRRADRTCIEGQGLRTLTQTVFLEDARCDGAAHDGCQRGCALFWNEAWLAADDGALSAKVDAPVDTGAEAEARRRLSGFAVRDGERYLCQSTALAAAAGPPPGLRALADDVQRGELVPLRLIEILGRTVARKTLALFGRGEIGALKGEDGRAIDLLGLRPGEQVRIKDRRRISATLNSLGRNRGMTFEPEMTGHAGRIYTVSAPVERMIHEETGRMVRLKSTVILEGADCQGRCARNCPRANPLFWREAWLERVPDAGIAGDCT